MNIIEVPIDDITTDKCIRDGVGDLMLMMRSIDLYGLLHPVGITKTYELVYGWCRLRACQKLGWQTIPAVFIKDDHRHYAIQRVENETRNDLTPEEKVKIAQRVEEEIRQHPSDISTMLKQASESGDHRDEKLCSNENEPVGQIREYIPKTDQENSNEKTRNADIAAKSAGFGNRKTYQQASSVVDNGSEKLKEAMNSKNVSISAAAQIAKLPKEEQDTLDYDDPKALKQKAKVLRMKKTEGVQAFDPEVVQLANQAEDWPDEKICQLIELLEKRVKRKGLVVIDGGKD